MQDLTIKRSKRKTLSLQCQPDGTLVVRAPLRMSKPEILEFVESKRAWIERSRRNLRVHRKREEALTLADGSEFPFLGRAFRIRRLAESGVPAELDLENDRIDIRTEDETTARTALLALIRESAKTYLPLRVAELAEHMGLAYQTLRIKEQKTRWGSCSNRGSLNLNARVMLAPPAVIDYLIVHELAHLVRMDHSRTFYQIVERYCPAYRTHQRWLREHGYLLRWAR